MKRLLGILPVLALLGPLFAGGFTVLNARGARAARSARDSAFLEVGEARKLAALSSSSNGPLAAGPTSLKTLVQETAQKDGLGVAFLSETERDLGKGRRERQVLVRLIEAEHGKVVAFLSDLEDRGGGAKAKEIRLRPSKSRTGLYDEVEVVLSHVTEAASGAKP